MYMYGYYDTLAFHDTLAAFENSVISIADITLLANQGAQTSWSPHLECEESSYSWTNYLHAKTFIIYVCWYFRAIIQCGITGFCIQT